MRTVTVISTQGDTRVQIDTSATNWGELKKDINAEGTFNANSSKVMIRGDRTPLSRDTDSIPSDSFSLFLTPEKIKSGH